MLNETVQCAPPSRSQLVRKGEYQRSDITHIIIIVNFEHLSFWAKRSGSLQSALIKDFVFTKSSYFPEGRTHKII